MGRRKTTTVSLAADREYVRALAVLAAERHCHMGDLVREALDQRFGPQLEEVKGRPTFFSVAQIVAHTQ